MTYIIYLQYLFMHTIDTDHFLHWRGPIPCQLVPLLTRTLPTRTQFSPTRTFSYSYPIPTRTLDITYLYPLGVWVKIWFHAFVLFCNLFIDLVFCFLLCLCWMQLGGKTNYLLARNNFVKNYLVLNAFEFVFFSLHYVGYFHIQWYEVWTRV